MTQKNNTLGYKLDQQIGFQLRKASQRHTTIFSNNITGGLTPTQFAAMAKLYEQGPMSQNLLGRETAMDAATIKGVVGRLIKRNLARTDADTTDKRRLVVSLTDTAKLMMPEILTKAKTITKETLAPLTAKEQAQLLLMLTKLG